MPTFVDGTFYVLSNLGTPNTFHPLVIEILNKN